MHQLLTVVLNSLSSQHLVVGFHARHANLNQQTALKLCHFVRLVRNLMSAQILRIKTLYTIKINLYDLHS